MNTKGYKRNIIITLSVVLAITLFLSIYLAIKINSHEPQTTDVNDYSNSVDFSPLINDWTIYSEAIGVTSPEDNEQKIVKIYSFIHKEKPLVLSMQNKIWDFDANKLPNIVRLIEDHIKTYNLTITSYEIESITENEVIILNLDSNQKHNITLNK